LAPNGFSFQVGVRGRHGCSFCSESGKELMCYDADIAVD
jgi:hypothetical protein